MAYVGFKKLEKKIEGQGKTPEQARRITASIGFKKYGKAKMARMAAEARKRIKR